MVCSLALAACLILLAAGSVWAAPVKIKTVRLTFKSYDTYDFNHIIDGLTNDKTVTVPADLIIPVGIKGKLPVVVAFHGSLGWQPHHRAYLARFNRMGVATVLVHSFTARGIKSTVGKQVRVTGQMMLSDAFQILKVLAANPRIDTSRIAIIGWSLGGVPVLMSAWEPVRKPFKLGRLKYAAHIAFYPPCMALPKTLAYTKAPTLVLVGAKDDWTGALPCVKVVAAIKKVGVPARIIVYPGAHHSFDSPIKVQAIPKAFGFAKCWWVIKDSGVTFDPKTGLDLTTPANRMKVFGACVSQGTHIGQNPAAKKRAMKDVTAFLTKVFNLRAR